MITVRQLPSQITKQYYRHQPLSMIATNKPYDKRYYTLGPMTDAHGKITGDKMPLVSIVQDDIDLSSSKVIRGNAKTWT